MNDICQRPCSFDNHKSSTQMSSDFYSIFCSGSSTTKSLKCCYYERDKTLCIFERSVSVKFASCYCDYIHVLILWTLSHTQTSYRLRYMVKLSFMFKFGLILFYVTQTNT